MDFLNQPFIVAGLMSIVSGLLVGINIWHNIRNSAAQSLKKSLNDKVNKADCYPSMRRVGKQIDKAEIAIENSENNIAVLKKALIFIVVKMDGKPSELGLM